MFNIREADRKALGVYSGIFICAGIGTYSVGFSFYWLIFVIGLLMGAVSLFSGKKINRFMRKIIHYLLPIITMLFTYSCGSTDPNPQYKLTLSVSPNEGGTVSSSKQIYGEEEIANITATANEEWRFDHWEGDFSGISSSASVKMDSDKNVTAVFSRKEYVLTVRTQGLGSVDEKVLPKQKIYGSGTLVELTAKPAQGWSFKEWKGDLAGTDSIKQITIDLPKDVTAIFARNGPKRFYLANNGVTVKCPEAEAGDIGIINGITYTKRIKSDITLSNAPTTCTSGITDMGDMFKGAGSFNGDISSWDVSSVTTMSFMFHGAKSFNGDLSHWDVSNVENMSAMFQVTDSFNGDISSWNVSSVTDMSNMFNVAKSFNGDLSSWNVSGVIDMSLMFQLTDNFNGNISSWDVSSVTDMHKMFNSAKSFNRDLSSWDVSSVKNMSTMFKGASFFNADISDWCVSQISEEPNEFAAGSALIETHKPNWGGGCATQ